VPTADVPVSWSRRSNVQAKLAAKQALLHQITNPKNTNFQPAEYGKYLYDAGLNKFFEFEIELWLSGLHTLETRNNPYAAGLPVASAEGCPHFDAESFNAKKQERTLLNNFRTQCCYCQPLRGSKRPRSDQQ